MLSSYFISYGIWIFVIVYTMSQTNGNWTFDVGSDFVYLYVLCDVHSMLIGLR